MSNRATAAHGTRRRIAEAALELFKVREFDDVTLVEVAQAAGVSHQTVLNHFHNKAGLIPAAGEVFSEQVASLEIDTIPNDVTSVVHATCRRYEAVGDANVRWAAMESRVPGLSEGLAQGRSYFQGWLAEMLSDLMPGDDQPQERHRVLLGLHAALDVHIWKLFRRDLGLGPEQTERQLTDLVLGVLARHRTGKD